MNNLDESKFIKLIENIPTIAVQGYNRNRNVIYWNKASELLYGFSKEEALGKKLEDLIIFDLMKNQVIKLIQNWYENDEVIAAGELNLKHKDGHCIYVYSSHVMFEEDNNSSEMFCIDIDLSFQKKQEELFHSFFELPINLQFIANTKGTILQVNNTVKSMLGYEREELINTSFMDLVHADDIEATVKEMKKLEDGESIHYFENRYRHANGKFINLAWSAVTNKADNLVYGSAQNITESKLIELEKNKQERIVLHQSRIAAVGEMLGNIAHQWRQPLSVISTAATGLKLSLEFEEKIDKKEIANTLDIVNDNVQYLSKTIDDFRNFFKDDLTLLKESNLKDTFKRIRNLTSASFDNSFIKYSQDIDDIYLVLNENLLIQALINLYNNSKDALVDKKYSRCFFVSVKKNKKNIVIKISDNGGGIKDTIIDKIFDPYFTTKHESIGTGIGLYMTNQIITKQMKGNTSVKNIEFECEGNKYPGAEFTIKF